MLSLLRLQRVLARSVLMRTLAIFSLPWFCLSCSQLADHGPISAKTQIQMEAMALTKDEFIQQMKRTNSRPTQSVTLPFSMKAGVPVLNAAINGHGFSPIMLDTGASRTMINASTAVAKKVHVLRAVDATVELQGVVGREQGRIGLLNPLVLGEWSLNGYPCLVRTFENRVAYTQGGPRAFPESLLGFDVALNACSFLTLDYRSKNVTFGFGKSFESQAGKRTAHAPFKVKQGVPMIHLQSGKVGWDAIVDTGSFNGIEISEEVAGHLGVKDKGRRVEGLYLMSVGGTVSSRQANLRTVKLPDLALIGDSYKDAEVDISPGPPRVGSYFLKDYRVTFDFRRKQFWLEW